MLVDEERPYPTCPTYFSGDEKHGLLASITEDADPELVVFELPGGKLRDRFPLVNCTGDVEACQAARSLWDSIQFSKPVPQWSPNGRYLAFAALQDDSSDLFVYDSQDGSLRRLTSGPDWVGPIEWSPNGTHIIMQEILNDSLLNYSSDTPSSVWSVSVSGSEVKQLYQTDAEYMRQRILQWLDDQRFIAYEGNIQDPMEGSLKPRFVDMEAGTSRLLFDDWFNWASMDPIHETLAIYKQPTDQTAEGTYMVSIKTGNIRRMEHVLQVDWDPQTGLFVSDFPCEQDPQSLQALDYQGNFRCVPPPVPTPASLPAVNTPAPDGKQALTVKDGLWLESDGQAEIQIIPEVPSDVTWCPDSTCFFFSLLQTDGTWTLYHVSLPGLEVNLVDNGIQSTGSYQWLGGGR
jgi:WD40 repeat protein